MAVGAQTLSEDTRIPIRFALYLGGVALGAFLAFAKVQTDVNLLQLRADQNDARDAVSVAERASHTQQLTELRVTLVSLSTSVKEIKDDLKDVKKATVPEDSVVRAGGRR